MHREWFATVGLRMLQQLHNAIVTNFFPALFDSGVFELETSLFFLPVRMGGLGIHDQLICVILTLVFPCWSDGCFCC